MASRVLSVARALLVFGTLYAAAAGMPFGLALIVLAVGGGISALKGSLEGISSATRLSALALPKLALAPLLTL